MVRSRRAVPAALVLALAGCIAFHPRSLPPAPSPPPSRSGPGGLRAGFGRADITPPPGVGLAGNGPEGKRATGYRLRLYARALLLEDGSGERLALLVADLPQISANLHRLTAQRIVDSTGVGADRLILAATHTHAGPGHFYAERQYNQNVSQVAGYDTAMVEFLVSRFARALLDARADLRPARAAWGVTAVWGHTRNRSYEAFSRNKPEWTPPAPVPPRLDPVQRAVDPTWTLLRVDQQARSGTTFQPAGAFSVFAIHGTGDAPENDLLDPGIHGIVERRVERHIDSLNGLPPGFRSRAVHLVANGTEGDVSPDWPANTRCGPPNLRPPVDPGGPRTPPAPWVWEPPPAAHLGLCLAAARAYVEAVGDTLGRRAVRLFDALANRLSGDVRLTVAFRALRLQGHPALCRHAEAGASTIGGAEDGRTRLYGWRLFGFFAVGLEEGGSAVDPNPTGCQREKRVAVGGLQRRWVVGAHGFPEVAQLSVARVGAMLLAAVPAEMTTMAGAMMKRAMRDSALHGDSLALIGLANGYMSYVTTDAEYGAQHYEGGSTLYGPRTAAVLAGALGALVAALGRAGDRSPHTTIDSLTAYPGKSSPILARPDAGPAPGTVARTVLELSCAGDTLRARWLDVYPGRLVPADGPVVRIERHVDAGWRTVSWDDDPAMEVRALRPRGRLGYLWEVRWDRRAWPARGALRVVLVARPGISEYASPECRA